MTKEKTITITVGGRTFSGKPISADKVYASNKSISAHMKDVTRSYQAKAAQSKRDIAKTVLNA
jgi:hypothetical protein